MSEEKLIALPPLEGADPNEKPISLAYRTFGDAKNPPLVLVMGLGGQLIAWNTTFVQMLADKGYYVVIYDNRDVGHSTFFDEFGDDKIANSNKILQENRAAIAAAKFEDVKPVPAPYSVEDLAKDCIRLMNALNIEKAHLAGASMGGMIVQTVYINFPSRVLSLTSIMSTAGPSPLPELNADPVVIAEFVKLIHLKTLATEKEEIINLGVQINKIFSGSIFDEEEVREKENAFYERAYKPAGVARQLLAIQNAVSRREALKKVSTEHPVSEIPVLVLHGAEDKLIPPTNAHDTAKCIEGAKVVILDKMGHNFPKVLFNEIVEAIASNAK